MSYESKGCSVFDTPCILCACKTLFHFYYAKHFVFLFTTFSVVTAVCLSELLKLVSYLQPKHMSVQDTAVRTEYMYRSGTWKFDCGLRQLMHTELHWLDVPKRVKYKLGVITRRCLYGSAPRYLAVCRNPVSRQHLRSATGHQLVIPSHRLTTYGRRAFSVAGLMFWNSLPRNLRDPSYTAAVFGRSLKTFLFSEY